MTDALRKAATNGDLTELQRLLASSHPTQETIQELLAIAAGNYQLRIDSRLPIIQFVLNQHPPTQVPEHALLKSTFSGSIPLFSAFFTKYNPSSIINTHCERHGTPLVVACTFRKPVAFVKFLLQNGADPNYLGGEDSVMMPLVAVAAMWRDNAAEAEAAVDVLLEYGATGIESALKMARSRQNEVVERRLLEHRQNRMTGSSVSLEPASLN